MRSCEWATFITVLAITIAKGKTEEEIAFLSLLFSQLGDTLAVLATEPPKCFKKAGAHL